MTIHTCDPSTIIVNQDSIRTKRNKAKIKKLKLSNESIEIKAITDTIEKNVTVHPKRSTIYYSNIVFNLGIGLYADKDLPNSYDYPNSIYLNTRDTLNEYTTYTKNKKGDILLQISLPYVNNFYLKPQSESPKFNTGFWGISAGIDYYYRNNRFANVSFSSVTDFFLPFPAAIDLYGEWEFMNSSYLSLSNNYKINRLSLGYGLSYSSNIWELKYFYDYDSPPNREPIKKQHYSFGLILSSYYQVGRNFNIGILYRPSFYHPDLKANLEYEHLISIDLAWKIKIK